MAISSSDEEAKEDLLEPEIANLAESASEANLASEAVSDESASEAVSQKGSQKGHQRTAAEGRMQVPNSWPRWKKQCGVVRRGRPPCRRWAVTGMPTCKYHGSGGARNRELGQLRYLAWVTLGAPDTHIKGAPVAHIVKLSLATFAEYIFSDANPVSVDVQIKAALWLADSGRSG